MDINSNNLNEILAQLPPEQRRNWRERKGLLKYRVLPEARPRLGYSVACKTCHKEQFVPSTMGITMSEDSINFLLILQGWIFGSAGYECPDCQNAWAEAVVEHINTLDKRTKEIEGTIEESAAPILTKQQLFERIGQLIDHVSVDYDAVTQTLKLAEVGVSRPISGQFQLGSQVGINCASDWLESVRDHLLLR